MVPPPGDHDDQLSPSFTYGRQHTAALACADQAWNTGRFDGSWEQAQSQDLNRGRDQRQDGYGKRRRSESPHPHNDGGRDFETRSEHTISFGTAAPWRAAEPDDRGWSHDQGHRDRLAHSRERSGEEGARNAARTDRGRDTPPRDLMWRGAGWDGCRRVPEQGGAEAVAGAAPWEAVERRAQVPADDRGRNHGPGHCEGQSREEGARNAARVDRERDGPRDLGRCGAGRDGYWRVKDCGGFADGSNRGHDLDGSGRWQRQTTDGSGDHDRDRGRDHRGWGSSFRGPQGPPTSGSARVDSVDRAVMVR